MLRETFPCGGLKCVALCCGIAASLSACGCNRSGLDLVPVEGVVTHDGSPIAGAGVVFSPSQGALPAMDVTDGEGRFELVTANQPGALVGEYKVSVSKSQTTAIPQSRGFPLYETKSLVPEKYTRPGTSGLIANVVDDDNYFEFKLEK